MSKRLKEIIDLFGEYDHSELWTDQEQLKNEIFDKHVWWMVEEIQRYKNIEQITRNIEREYNNIWLEYREYSDEMEDKLDDYEQTLKKYALTSYGDLAREVLGRYE